MRKSTGVPSQCALLCQYQVERATRLKVSNPGSLLVGRGQGQAVCLRVLWTGTKQVGRENAGLRGVKSIIS